MKVADTGHAYPILIPGEGDGSLLPDPAERPAVSFEGLDVGVELLTWGQWSIWEAMSRHGSWLPLGGSKPLEPGVTVADVADELRYLMTRYPSMRTRLRFDSSGDPRQELFGSGEIEFEVYDVGDDGITPGTLAAAVEAHYRHTPFDFAGDWPIRMAVIRWRGELTHMVVIMCHLVTDGAGARVMLREVESRTTVPPAGMQQLEQARWQASAAGRRQNDMALRYHESLLRKIAPHRLPDYQDPQSPRYWTGELRSCALLPAAQAIAERTGVASSPVLLALFAVALARLTGINPVVVRPLVGNRFRPGLADVVCMLALPGLCALDVAEVSIDEAVSRAQRATMSAYKYGYYDPRQLAGLLSRIAQERGPDFDISCLYNDRRDELPAQPTGRPVTREDLHAARGESTFRWGGRTDNPSDRMFLSVEDEPEGLLLAFSADTRYFPPKHFEALVRGIEDIAIEAAFDAVAPTKVAGSG